MGRSRYKIYDENNPCFVTCTVLNWIPLFTRQQTQKIILDALEYRQRENGWRILAYVILENHLHMIVQSPHLKRELPRFKSYTARQLIDYLQDVNASRLLQQFASLKKQHKRDRKHQLWEEGSHPQEIIGQNMLRQKIEYIHQNPVKRGYVDKPEYWRNSSAGNYLGSGGVISVETGWLG